MILRPRRLSGIRGFRIRREFWGVLCLGCRGELAAKRKTANEKYKRQTRRAVIIIAISRFFRRNACSLFFELLIMEYNVNTVERFLRGF